MIWRTHSQWNDYYSRANMSYPHSYHLFVARALKSSAFPMVNTVLLTVDLFIRHNCNCVPSDRHLPLSPSPCLVPGGSLVLGWPWAWVTVGSLALGVGGTGNWAHGGAWPSVCGASGCWDGSWVQTWTLGPLDPGSMGASRSLVCRCLGSQGPAQQQSSRGWPGPGAHFTLPPTGRRLSPAGPSGRCSWCRWWACPPSLFRHLLSRLCSPGAVIPHLDGVLGSREGILVPG